MANPTKTRYENWLGTTVYDSTGEKLGDITDVFYDDVTGQPEWMTVSTGWFGTSEQFVPIAGTKQHEDGFRTGYTKDQIKDAPSIDTDQDHLDATEERRLYDHYGLSYDAPAHERAYGGRERAAEGYDYSDQRSHQNSDAHTDAASVTRSEEQLAVDKRQRESGRVRLHKYVVTEDVDLKVPVKRQVARIVREPASGTGSIGDESDEGTVHETVRKEKVDVEGDVRESTRR